MSLSPFPALQDKDLSAPEHELASFPNAGHPGAAPQFYPGAPAIWAKPRLEPVQAIRTRAPTGLRALDDHLGGGLPGGSLVAVVGPPFGGKRTLACQFLAAGLGAGQPALAAITDGDVTQWRQAVAQLTSRVPEERKGLVCYLELGVEGRPDLPLTERILSAVANACESLPSDRRRFVLDSFTTIVAVSGYDAAMGMLMRLSSMMRREGATCMVLLESGAHSALELQLVKRQADGAFEFRQDAGQPEIQVTGFGLPTPSPWLPGRNEARVEIRDGV